MEHLQEILNVPITQLLGLVIVLAVAERMGIPIISMTRWALKLENSKEAHHEQIGILQNHAKVANHEMGDVKESIGKIEKRMDSFEIKIDSVGKEVSFIAGKLSK